MKRLASLLLFLAFAGVFFLPSCQATCTTTDDCDKGEVCILASGKCAATCDPKKADSCGSNAQCDACATNSCKTCEDCIPACVELQSGAGGPGGW